MICTKCHKDKPLSDFRDSKHGYHCKDCRLAMHREWRRRNIIKARKYQQDYYAKFGKNRREWTVDMSEAIEEWRKNNPEKFAAKSIIHRAVQRGKIIKPKKCTKCGREVLLSGHHPDYTKPLEVIWLCGSCHKLLHLAMKAR